MPLTNKLTSRERRNEYYQSIQLGEDVKTQINAINRQTKVMIATQLASTNTIVASKERIAEGLDVVSCGISNVENGLHDLKSAFEWGISEVVWQIEQNRCVLKDILSILMAPLDNQAKERRKRAEEAYSNGWIDDAEEEFLEAAKLNKFDFAIHISLGLIYLFQKIDKEKALSCFEKAAKYAKPKSSYHTSYALLYMALIKFEYGQIDEAEQLSAEAINLSESFSEAYYQNAQYNAQLKNINKSISNLEKAIEMDRNYCLKAHNDLLFDPIRKSVNNLFEKLREREKQKSLILYENNLSTYNTASPILNDLTPENFIDFSYFTKEFKTTHALLVKMENKINRNSFFDYHDINHSMVYKLEPKVSEIILNLKKQLQTCIDNSKVVINAERTKHSSKTKRYFSNSTTAAMVFSFLVPAITSLIAYDGWAKLFFLLFLVPGFSQLLSLALVCTLIANPSHILRGESIAKGDIFVASSIIIYLVGVAIYFFSSLSKSKNVKDNKITREGEIIKKASSYLDKIKKHSH